VEALAYLFNQQTFKFACAFVKPNTSPDDSAGSPRARAVLGELADVDLRLLRVLRAVPNAGAFRPPSWS